MKKRTKIIVGILIAFGPIILVVIIANTGTIDIVSVLEFILSPLLIVLLLEYSAIILLIESFLFSKKWRRILQLIALGIAVGLVIFYFYIPYIPVEMSPNHPDSDQWNSGKVVHILPAVSDNRILLKVSFSEPINNPKLKANGTYFPGVQTDTIIQSPEGFDYWYSRVPGDTTHVEPGTAAVRYLFQSARNF
ncbi:MAG: hypothetical protein ACTSRP_24370 [Candidatus Helarchaeota archaeon]